MTTKRSIRSLLVGTAAAAWIDEKPDEIARTKPTAAISEPHSQRHRCRATGFSRARSMDPAHSARKDQPALVFFYEHHQLGELLPANLTRLIHKHHRSRRECVRL